MILISSLVDVIVWNRVRSSPFTRTIDSTINIVPLPLLCCVDSEIIRPFFDSYLRAGSLFIVLFFKG